MKIKHIFLTSLVVFLPFSCQAQDEQEQEEQSQEVTPTVSKLSFPNTFTPNDDNYNDKFKAKECQNIIEFHAYIFNRWGQKLYDWTNPEEGWDGNYNGNPVEEGVYFLLCKAKGTDGQDYNIRKDVNLLRTTIDGTNNN